MLTQDQLGLIATAIRYGRYPPKPEYLPACHHLAEQGWLTRHVDDNQVSFSLSAAGVTALELGVTLDDAKGALN